MSHKTLTKQNFYLALQPSFLTQYDFKKAMANYEDLIKLSERIYAKLEPLSDRGPHEIVLALEQYVILSA